MNPEWEYSRRGDRTTAHGTGLPGVVRLYRDGKDWVATTWSDTGRYTASPARTRDFAVENLIALYQRSLS